MTISMARELAEGGEGTAARGIAPFSVRLHRWLFHRAIRMLTLAYCITLRAVSLVAGKQPRRRRGAGVDILLTGRFDSDNWIISHLGPLSASKRCDRLAMVTTRPLPALSGVRGIVPPHWLVRSVGVTPARLMTFAWTAIRTRPDVVGGFHLLVNGMAATIVGRLVGAQTMYFCVGGPNEVRDGGVWGEGNYFARMETPDPVVERRLLKAVSACDMVITMGTGAASYFEEKLADSRCYVVSGGIDSSQYSLNCGSGEIDLIMTGRLVAIKRIDVLLRAVARIADQLPDVQVAIVGDGEARGSLERLAEELGIGERVSFAGYQRDVAAWLDRAKVFMLTSDSEGLPLAVMEAMMCGLPVVASNVGDLADLVEDGVNGYLVPRRSVQTFAQRAVELLRSPAKLQAFARAARQSALRYDTGRTIQQWDAILGMSMARAQALLVE